MRLPIGIALLALITACSMTADGPESTDRSTTQPSDSDPPIVEPESTRAPGAAVISGLFSTESIEGGCPHLATDDGTRYQVIYPNGWILERNPSRLVNPAGEVVATGGETISVSGLIADDMASICQIGPMFVADEVISIDD